MRVIVTLLMGIIFFVGYRALDIHEETELFPEHFLPVDTVALFHQENGLQILDNFRSSQFGRTLADIDIAEVAEYIELDDSVISRVENTIGTLRELRENPLLKRLLGTSCSLAVFPRRAWSRPVHPIQPYLLNQAILISRQFSLRSFISELKGLYPKYSEPVSVRFGRHVIHRISLENRMLYVSYSGGYLLLTTEERVLREALDTFDTPEKNLFTNANYNTVYGQTSSTGGRFYLDIKSIRQACTELRKYIDDAKYIALLNELSKMTGFTTAGYGGYTRGDTTYHRLMIQLQPDNLPPITGRMLSQVPEVNGTAGFAVDNTLLYYWSNTLNLKLLWEMYLTEVDPEKSKAEKIALSIREITGYRVEDLAELFRNDVSFLFRPSEHDQFIPIPDMAFIIKLKNRKDGEVLMNAITESFNISLQSRKYKNIKYFYWGLYPMESLQPVYAIHKDYLIIANTLDIFKSIVDLKGDKDTLVDNIAFSQIDPGFVQKNNSVCYMDVKTTLMQMRELISWGGTMLAIQDRQAAAKSKILIDRLINPFLLGLTMYEKVATRTYMEEDWIMTETTIHTNRENNAETR